VPLLHTWLSFTRPSPTLVLQATNAGVRRPGYEASTVAGCRLTRMIVTPQCPTSRQFLTCWNCHLVLSSYFHSHKEWFSWRHSPLLPTSGRASHSVSSVAGWNTRCIVRSYWLQAQSVTLAHHSPVKSIITARIFRMHWNHTMENMSYKMTVHMILSYPPWLTPLCHAMIPPHKPYKLYTWLIDLLWKWLNNLVATATLVLEYLFYILIFNGGKLLVIILFLLLSVTWMGHTVKGR